MGGYFWLPCDRCSKPFGGFEHGWKPRNSAKGDHVLLCPSCHVETRTRWPRLVKASLSGGFADLPAEEANEIASLVTALFGEYVPFSVRYGIAHAVLSAGFRKPHSIHEGESE